MRIQRIILKHHRNISVLRFYVVYKRIADIEFAGSDFFKTGYHTKRGGFSATRRSDEYNKFLIFYIHREVVYGFCSVGINFVYVIEFYVCHNYPLIV